MGAGYASGAPASPLEREACLQDCLDALAAGETERALSAARHFRDTAPDDGRAHHLLGAIHAELGLHARAAEDLERAVDLAPESRPARFQLGLLLLMHLAGAERAREVWRGLDGTDPPDALRSFKDGMLALVDGDLDRAMECLERGIAEDDLDPALSADMLRIAERARALRGEPGASDESDGSPEPLRPEPESARRLLEAYRRNLDEGAG